MISKPKKEFQSPLQLEAPKMEDGEILEFEFLNDSDQSGDCIEVEVKYKSDSPIMAKKRVIVKEKGSTNEFFIDIHVSADNSLFSTYAYIVQSARTHQTVWMDDKIRFIPMESQSETSSIGSSPSITPFTNDQSQSTERFIKTPTISTNLSSSKQSGKTLTDMSHLRLGFNMMRSRWRSSKTNQGARFERQFENPCKSIINQW